MIRRLLKIESGYSLVEVLAAIMILAIAIIPMVGMFDAGLRSASLGGNYDTARALANKQLERAKGLSYENVRKHYPFNAPNTAPMAGGTYESPTAVTSTSAPHEVPQGFRYSVVKQYKAVPEDGGTSLDVSSSDQGLIEVKVSVAWGDSNDFTVTAIKAR